MIEKLKSFFKREEINTSRQKNIDFAKAFSIIFMIFIHTLMVPPYAGLETTVFGNIANNYMGGFMAAPVFMCVMGVGLAFSRHTSSKQIFKRATKFIIIGFIINILRGISPIIVACINHDPNLNLTIFRIVFNGDILVFVGLALILFVLLKKIKYHEIIIPCVGLLFSVIVTAIPPIRTDNLPLSFLGGYFFPIGYLDNMINAPFPLMSWFIYVAFGYGFALILRRIKDLNRFYAVCIVIGLVVLVPIAVTENIYNYGSLTHGDDELREYMNILPDAIMSFGFTIFAFGFWHFICKKTPELINNFIHKIADSINEIYLISWVVISNASFLVIIFAFNGLNDNVWIYIISFIIIFVSSTASGLLWRKRKIKRNAIKNGTSLFSN